MLDSHAKLVEHDSPVSATASVKSIQLISSSVSLMSVAGEKGTEKISSSALATVGLGSSWALTSPLIANL